MPKVNQKARTAGGRALTPEELDRLLERLLESTDQIEIARLKSEMERGFYGDPEDA